jgi:cell division protein FtsX
MILRENLGRLWRRIQTYKNLMVLTIALNVLVASSGLVASYLLWTGAFQLSNEILSQNQKQTELLKLSETLLQIPDLDPKKTLTRESALKELRAWENLFAQARTLGLKSANNPPDDYFLNAEKGRSWKAEVKAEVAGLTKAHQAKVLNLAQREDRMTSAVLWIMALTLVFGVALPLILFSLILNSLRRAQKALAETAKEIVQDWSRSLSRYGDDPFKNAHFWIEAILIVSEQVGQQSRHPAAQLSAELSHLVREELHKAKNKAA